MRPSPIIPSCICLSPFEPELRHRSRVMALSDASPSHRNIAVPATTTLAASGNGQGAVSASIPPSTSRSHSRFDLVDHLRARPIFGSVVWMKC